ncbi:MAG TPA: hypothetical protein PK014_08920 [Thermoanaerobaculia bacterium]|nr:hypothetical protein [Thermoanaerobaculia bacterium]HUM30307.1 hypothetical protein [Thermoanaerobaculia bacterium]HXK68542.1 hypothetical protein [Thermoanaerobaculia bacterium]
MKRFALFFAILASTALFAAEPGVSYIQYLENEGLIVPARNGETIAAQVNLPVYPGDTLNTRDSGRMIVALSDGNLAFLDRQTRLDMRALAYTDGYPDRRTYLFLQNGSTAFYSPMEAYSGEVPVLGCSFADLYLGQATLARVDTGSRRVTVKVFDGEVEISTSRGSATVGRNEMAYIYEDGYIERFGLRSRSLDDFDRWFQATIQRRNNSESRRYAGDSLGSYSYVLDDHGSWVYVPEYSTYAWRPVVTVEWRPYTSGYWYDYPGGYYWMSYEPWGYVTYHYGRWVFSPSHGWIWFPGYVWSGAWVYWSVGPGWIGWCPIGYYDWWWWGYDPWYWRPPHCWDCYHRIHGYTSVWAGDRNPWIVVSSGGFLARDLPHRIYSPEQVAKIRNDKAIVTTRHLPLTTDELRDPSAAYRRLSTNVKDQRDVTSLFSAREKVSLSSEGRELLQSSLVRTGEGKDPFDSFRPSNTVSRTALTERTKTAEPVHPSRYDLTRSKSTAEGVTGSREIGADTRRSGDATAEGTRKITGLDRSPVNERPSVDTSRERGTSSPTAVSPSPNRDRTPVAGSGGSGSSRTDKPSSSTTTPPSREPSSTPSTGSSSTSPSSGSSSTSPSSEKPSSNGTQGRASSSRDTISLYQNSSYRSPLESHPSSTTYSSGERTSVSSARVTDRTPITPSNTTYRSVDTSRTTTTHNSSPVTSHRGYTSTSSPQSSQSSFSRTLSRVIRTITGGGSSTSSGKSSSTRSKSSSSSRSTGSSSKSSSSSSSGHSVSHSSRR